MNCGICGKPVILIPSAVERARKHGQTAAYYTGLFRNHSECEIAKRSKESIALMRRLVAEAKNREVLL